MNTLIHFVMTPIGLFFIGFFAACAILAVMLVRGARNARLANEIYDGAGPEAYDPRKPLKLATDDVGHPLFTKWAASDQEGCRHCGQTWDRNDLHPPLCVPLDHCAGPNCKATDDDTGPPHSAECREYQRQRVIYRGKP